MSPRATIVTVLLLTMLIALSLWWSQQPPQTDHRADTTAPTGLEAPQPVEQPVAVEPRVGVSGSTTPQPAFEDAVQLFLEQGPGLPPAEALLEAQRLQRLALEREALGLLTPAESAFAQLAVLEALKLPAAELEARRLELLLRYEGDEG